MSIHNPKIIIINGSPRAGKDTFVSLCKKYIGWTFNYSTVDFVKKIATECGWDGTKTPENRKFLSDLKSLLNSWNDVTFKKTLESVTKFKQQLEDIEKTPVPSLIFIHCREPKEIARYVEKLGAKTLIVKRDESETELSNDSDKLVSQYEYDFQIENNGTLEELEEKAQKFIQEVVIGE